MPRLIEEVYPGAEVQVIEIDPVVTDVAHRYLGLPRDTSIVTYNLDARMKIPDLAGGELRPGGGGRLQRLFRAVPPDDLGI